MSYLLLFDDGPAEGQRIETSVQPSWTRWFVQVSQNDDDGSPRTSWWAIDREPPPDPNVKITRYDCASSGPSSADCEVTVLHFATKES